MVSDKLILRFIQDNIITDKKLSKCIDIAIAGSREEMDGTSCKHVLHNTMFSMCLKTILFKYLYKMLQITFLEQFPNSCWYDLVKGL